MNFNVSKKFINLGLVSALTFLVFSCQRQADVQGNGAQTPTDAYKMLYAAVKAKDTEKIKQIMSKDTQGLAQFLAERQKQPIEKSYENGFTATTFADTLPEIRAERVNDKFGAVEVYNQKEKRWEDLPFIKEDNGWKLAVGDVFKGAYKSPGKGQLQAEQEAANASGNNVIQMMPNGNLSANVNVNTKSIDSPQSKKPK